MRGRLLLGALCASLAAASPAMAAPGDPPWPPRTGPGVLFVHYGEEHVTDHDGAFLLHQTVADSARYRPVLVTMSGDKSDDGPRAKLEEWLEVMSHYDQAGIPYFAAVGNHDRDNLVGGFPPAGGLDAYIDVFKGRHFPFGDAPPPSDPRFSPSARTAGDPEGASSHYFFDYANTRWIFLDNSCYGFVTPGAACDQMQHPPFPDGPAANSYSYMRLLADEATAQGKLVFVVMHMPTQDPRRPHSNPTPFPHTMGEGQPPYATENARFDDAAARAGVDGVFEGHIKGQWTYEAGGVPHYIDGGAGGELYTDDDTGPGIDTGYWHGYRLVRVTPEGEVITDAVPILRPGGITISGESTVPWNESIQLAATGVEQGEDPRVEVALRTPDQFAPEGDSLPIPAYIWTADDEQVLQPVPDRHEEDPRRDPETQTVSGEFRGICPGRTRVRIASGWEGASTRITVRSRSGRILRASIRRARTVRRGRATKIASLRLAQAARVQARITRGRRTIRTLSSRCWQYKRNLAYRWNGRSRSGRALRRGRYVLELRIRSDRRTQVRRFGFSLR